MLETDCLKIAIVGGSNSVMKAGYSLYLRDYIETKLINKKVEIKKFAVGGVTNIYANIQNIRYEIAKDHDIIFYEYCVNDRTAISNKKYSIRLSGMALEGFIRSAKLCNPSCVIIVLIFGVNNSTYYNNHCSVSSLYESIARRYGIPSINITELLLETNGIEFIKELYDSTDPAHYSKTRGVQIVSELIAKELFSKNLLQHSSKDINDCYRVYAKNFHNLKFYDSLDKIKINGCAEKSVFKNSLVTEEILTIKQGSSIDLTLEGELIGIVLKSDWYDGFFKISLGQACLITSSFSSSIDKEGKHNINLITLCAYKSLKCNKPTKLSISLCEDLPDKYELDIQKTLPKTKPSEWKLSIAGIAYLGKLS